MNDTPEFSRPFDIRGITAEPVKLSANAEERRALAKRFDIVSVDRLEAEFLLEADGAVISAKGTLDADILQSCAVSGEDLPAAIHEAIDLRFVPGETLEVGQPETEVELDADELDEIGYDGTGIDLGEAAAQSLALAIDPFATGPEADAARERHGLADGGPKGALAQALAGLKKDME
ncbi:YceD family protein [Aurantiacibacter marinus]|uniref:DNA-binding protein n=1 Tax=Aurantiacibacter marinus TaxID=874156 RepID=A0A0H0XRR6_9SPHN|nr:DUF177 domain-containing protein [Aurantiacibacter marinus]KLI65034.1 hypothetical protein AAV99_06105 [Aurantiacibacter marinus]